MDMLRNMQASLKITVRPFWLSAPFLRIFARPFVLIDKTEHTARWGIPQTFTLPEGDYVVAAGIRYRGSKTLLGASPVTFTLRRDRETSLEASNGLLNHTPFIVAEVR